MAPKEAPIRIRRSDGIIHVDVLEKKLVDNTRIRQIGDELEALIDTESQLKMIVNLSGVDLISSFALGALVAVHKKALSKQGQLRLVGVTPPVYNVLRYTGLTPLLEIHDSTEDAIASMS